MNQEPEWIVVTLDDPSPRKVEFKDLFGMKDRIVEIILLWDYNSYIFNVNERFFIVNGGKRVQPTVLPEMKSIQLFYARRQQMDVTVGDDLEEKEKRTSYLIGAVGLIDGEEKTILVHVSADGQMWAWRDRR